MNLVILAIFIIVSAVVLLVLAFMLAFLRAQRLPRPVPPSEMTEIHKAIAAGNAAVLRVAGWRERPGTPVFVLAASPEQFREWVAGEIWLVDRMPRLVSTPSAQLLGVRGATVVLLPDWQDNARYHPLPFTNHLLALAGRAKDAPPARPGPLTARPATEASR